MKYATAALVVLTGCAHRYRVDGLVVSVNPAARTALVSHREIKGYMPAMSMPFRFDKLDGLAPGAHIEFELRSGKARKVRVLKQDLGEIRLPAPTIRIGSAVPDFVLTDQLNRPTALSAFLGRVVVIDFIYTRCPLPEVCPRLSANFARLQKRFAGREVTLLSITVDPQFDTPEVLADYGRRWRANPEQWRFLTGDVRPIAAMFGLLFWAEDYAITHSNMTAVVGRDGKLAAMVEGAGYTAEQLGDIVQTLLAK
jgi:protein SCO1/2